MKIPAECSVMVKKHLGKAITRKLMLEKGEKSAGYVTKRNTEYPNFENSSAFGVLLLNTDIPEKNIKRIRCKMFLSIGRMQLFGLLKDDLRYTS